MKEAEKKTVFDFDVCEDSLKKEKKILENGSTFTSPKQRLLKDEPKEMQESTLSQINGTDGSPTPYDDAFRTMLEKCSRWIVPVINEIFKEDYALDTTIVKLEKNEFYQNVGKGKQKKLITDSNLVLEDPTIGLHDMRYHFECQSDNDNEIAIRLFEYGSLIAASNSELKGNTLTVKFPRAAVLYLRSCNTTPDDIKMRIETPGGNIDYLIPVMKVANYDIHSIMEKKLYFLIPFLLFNYEDRFESINQNSDELDSLVGDYRHLNREINRLYENKVLGENDRYCITSMECKVLSYLAKNYQKIVEGVGTSMRGMVLETDVTRIAEEAEEKGEKKGEERLSQLITYLIKDKRSQDIVKITQDEQYRKQLYQHYSIEP